MSNGAEPATNKRMCEACCFVSVGSVNIRTYKVGTPINTVASGIFWMTNFGSNFDIQIILLPLSNAP